MVNGGNFCTEVGWSTQESKNAAIIPRGLVLTMKHAVTARSRKRTDETVEDYQQDTTGMNAYPILLY